MVIKNVWQNKVDKWFNTIDVNKEYCYLFNGFILNIGFDLVDEIDKKVSKNKKRVYKNIDGVNVRVSDWLIMHFKKDNN